MRSEFAWRWEQFLASHAHGHWKWIAASGGWNRGRAFPSVSLGATRSLTTLLYHVAPNDPLTFVADADSIMWRLHGGMLSARAPGHARGSPCGAAL